DRGVDAHRRLVRILAGNALVHLEQVAVALGHRRLAETADRVGEVEVHAQAARTDAATFVAHVFGVARRDVARHQVAEARILALQVVVAVALSDAARRFADIFFALRNPDAAVV